VNSLVLSGAARIVLSGARSSSIGCSADPISLFLRRFRGRNSTNEKYFVFF